MNFLALSLLLAPTLAAAKTISIAVGQDGLKFTPSVVTAAVGDKLDFHFYPKNHSVVASSFSKPCTPVQPDGGLYSGFRATTAEDPSVFEVTVNDTNPIWIYCSQITHCEGGMSMVVNQPSGSNTLAAYQAASKSVARSQSPVHVAGGVFVPSNGTANGTSTSGSNSTHTSSTGPSPTTSQTIIATPTPGEAGRTGIAMCLMGALVAGAFVAGMV